MSLIGQEMALLIFESPEDNYFTLADALATGVAFCILNRAFDMVIKSLNYNNLHVQPNKIITGYCVASWTVDVVLTMMPFELVNVRVCAAKNWYHNQISVAP